MVMFQTGSFIDVLGYFSPLMPVWKVLGDFETFHCFNG